MKRFNKVVALSLAVVLGTAMGCFAQNSEWKNDLRTKFLNNESVIMEINLRSFNAQDLDGDGFIQEDLGEVKGSFINAIARLDELKNLCTNYRHLYQFYLLFLLPKVLHQSNLREQPAHH